jgi:hypothetical protein
VISRLLILQLVICACSFGCKNEKPPAASRQEEQSPAVTHLPLADHVPSVGLRWLVHLKPQKLVNHPTFQRDWQVVFEADRVRAFTQVSGFDPHQVTDAWIGGYDLGVLYLFDARATGDAAQEAFLARSLSSQEIETPYNNLTHFTGIIENTPHALLHVREHLIAIAAGDIQLIRIVRAYAEQKLKRSPPVLASKFLVPHARFEEEALARIFFRGPYEDATDSVVGGVLSGVGAATLVDGSLRLKTQVLGAWPVEHRLAESLGGWVDQVLSTRELRAFGWGFPTVPPQVTCKAQPADLSLCNASGSWDSAAIARALYRVTAGSMKDLVDEPPWGWHPEATIKRED